MRFSRSLILGISLTVLLALSGCSEERIGMHSALDNGQGLPEPISVVRHLSAAESGCSTQGIQVTHGLDHNHDGTLSPYERSNSSLVCLPNGSQDGPAVAHLPKLKNLTAQNDG